MRNGKCTDGLRRIAMLAAVALMMALATGCGDDECDDGELLMDLGDGDGEQCLSICSDDDECSGDATCEATEEDENVCVGDEDDNGNGNGEPECTDDGDCGDGEVCEDEQCVEEDVDECTSDGECGDDEICDDGQCVDDPAEPECTDDSDCAQGFECVDEECVEEPVEPECSEDGDCSAGLICHNDECVECYEDGHCDGDWVCDQNVCEDPDAWGDEELCEAYCTLELGCMTGEADTDCNLGIDGLPSINDCVHGGAGDPGCMGQINSDPEYAERVDLFVYGDFDDPDNEFDFDNPNTCDDVSFLHCGYFGLAPYCDTYCEAPGNVGGSCTIDSDCPVGSLELGVCLDTAMESGFESCTPGQGDCSGDEECLEASDGTDTFHVCGISCTPQDQDCDGEDICLSLDESGTEGVCGPDPDDDGGEIEDGMCMNGFCWVPENAAVDDVNIDGASCGSDGACVATELDGGTVLGLCMTDCDSNSDCEEGRACQPTGGDVFESDGVSGTPNLGGNLPSTVGPARTCDFACEEDSDCGSGDFHCNEDGICEEPCEDVDCDGLGGDCYDVDGTEYCGLD